MLDKLHDYHFEYFVKFFDYKSWLAGCYKELAGISGCHFFHFTPEGVRAYTDALDNPISDSPLEVITHSPSFECPPYFSPPPISADRLKKFEKAKKPSGTNLFWENILQGGLGTNQPKLLNPNFIEHVCFQKRKSDEKEEGEEKEKEREPEEAVVKFGKLISDEERDCYLLETQFSDSKEFILNERSCFIDEIENGEPVFNEQFKKWENEHPILKRKFMSKPSEYSMKEKKQRLSKESTGPVLSSGRSRGGQ